ncbi:MFS-type transporter SLC18B1-like [Arctopsyche grandis]|uniref:MFS-type transporter SLC18B1-like n=1 Tax=Arctopsyche grandis TaxID=121162 RepID=UPI00406D8B9C
MPLDFTRRQWMTLIAMSIADFCNAICVSLQAPFYPQEAERKGCTATEYGLVFGIFELVVFLVSPIYGANLNRVGAKKLFNGGILTTATCAILFGLLDKVDGHYPFIILSFVIRIIEAMGNAAFLTASFAIIAKEFPDNVATMFASLETCFGLGLIIGPTVGGALYSIGGYTTPFAIMGSILFVAAIMTYFALPMQNSVDDESDAAQSLKSILKIPGVLMAVISLTITSASIGFLQATLEPHLRQFNLSPVVLGLMFIINGGMYAVTAPLWGWVCDKLSINPKWITLLGCIFIAVAFMLIGPAPYLQIGTTLWMTIFGLVLHGFGISCQLVASFTDALKTAIAHGFPNTIETYGLVSGLWTSTFALGAFIGPTASGFLYDKFGFRNSTLFIFVLHAVAGVLFLIHLLFFQRRGDYTELTVDTSDLTMNDGKIDASYVNGDGSLKNNKSQPGICIEQTRPSGMNSLIACNSFKNRAGGWKRRDGSRYCRSYGSLEGQTYRMA